MSTNGYKTNRLVAIDVPDYTEDITTQDAECCDKMVEGVNTLNTACEMAAANGTPIKIFPMTYCPWCGKSFTESAKEFIQKNKAVAVDETMDAESFYSDIEKHEE